MKHTDEIPAEFVYKVVDTNAWQSARKTGTFDGSDDDKRDGYIHLSTASQLPGTLEKHFHTINGLLIVCFATTALAQNLKWEPSRGGALFPHYFGPLPTERALWDAPLPLTPEGHHQLPENIK